MDTIPIIAPPMPLGVRLQTARRLTGLTQTQLADVLGISRKSVFRFESGEGTPSPALIGAWADVARFDQTGREWLFGDRAAAIRSR